jgi:AcrR family transcriptional regulator
MELKPANRPLRRDAERSRRRLIDAAREVFAQRGLDVTLDDIARHAGLGIGTAYRHFPDKEALIDIVFELRADEIVAIAERAAARPDSWDALAGFMEEINTFMAGDRGLRDVLFSSSRGAESAARTRRRLAPAVDALLRRAKDDGHLRPDAERADLLLADVMVDAARTFTAPVAPEQWRRCLALVLDGLRARRDGPTPLPQPPLDEATANRAMTRPPRPRPPAPAAQAVRP